MRILAGIAGRLARMDIFCYFCSMLPEGFIEEMRSLPGLDFDAFARAMSGPASVSIKLNRRKCTDPAETGYTSEESVKWCGSGYYLAERPKFTLNPLMHGGAFYVQDASSMIYETIVDRLIADHGLSESALTLDMCAAPGGKTTSMINSLGDGATVIANEIMPQRAKALRENLLKWGFPRIMATSNDTSRFARCGEAFDLIAVDAPCSGEGMMRKEEMAVSQWSPGLVKQCAALQREILENAVAALRPGGFLVYSTCTFNRHEDEENVEWLIEQRGLESVDLNLPEEWDIGTQIGSPYPAMRFMPHITRGEGLFAAVFRKPGDAPATNHEKARDMVRKNCKVILDGIPTVTAKGKIEIPASEWALSTDFLKDRFPRAELDTETALSYLRHEAIRLGSETPKGFVVVTYKGHPLGFVKNIGNRANNLYPAEWRIRNL